MLHIIIDKNKVDGFEEISPDKIESLFREYGKQITAPYEADMSTIVIQNKNPEIIKSILQYVFDNGYDEENIIVDNRISREISPISSYRWML